MKRNFVSSSQANEWALKLVAAAGEASKKSLGEVSHSYVIGVLTSSIKALLLDADPQLAKRFMDNELRYLETK